MSIYEEIKAERTRQDEKWGEGSYICTAEGADCFATLLKALGYTAEIEELDDEQSSGKDGAF